MKKSQILLLSFNISLSSGLISPAALASDSDAIWLYVYLIPVYFILALQSLLGLFMLAMKQFNSRKSILITMIPASLLMLIGILIMLYFQSLNELWGLLSIYLIFGLFIFVLPSSQYLILNKFIKNSEEDLKK
jgi:hypothetical protein|tara:strand:+ start:252 stop:650 length:399 start_codon:yes stop_codon:yes gene_type:complete